MWRLTLFLEVPSDSNVRAGEAAAAALAPLPLVLDPLPRVEVVVLFPPLEPRPLLPRPLVGLAGASFGIVKSESSSDW